MGPFFENKSHFLHLRSVCAIYAIFTKMSVAFQGEYFMCSHVCKIFVFDFDNDRNSLSFVWFAYRLLLNVGETLLGHCNTIRRWLTGGCLN